MAGVVIFSPPIFSLWVVFPRPIQPPQHKFLQIARVGHRICRGQHAHHLRIGDKQQRAAAERVMASAASWWKDPIVTQLEPFEAFYEAEDYHHDYYARVGDRNPYCTYVVSPKVAKMRTYLAEKGS